MVLKAAENQGSTKTDWFKWFLVVAILAGGVVLNYIYSSQPWPLRLLAWIVLLCASLGVASLTSQGKKAINFAGESRVELRKVFWPTRQETMQTTMFVGIMVVILALFLWGVDSVLMWVIGWLTGQRG